jgi:Acetyltransferase (GNAT) domain
MTIMVRPADRRIDRHLLTGLLSRHLSSDSVEERFNWLYQENPHGPAKVWLAQDEVTGKAIGCAAAFPRRLWTSGSIQTGHVLGDFCTDVEHRSLGLALRLQRVCLDYVGANSSGLTYDFPSNRMMAIYKRFQITPFCQIVRWAKPLRADRKLSEFLKSRLLRLIVAAQVNKLLHWKDLARRKQTADWTIASLDGKCGEEFTVLANSLKDRNGWCVDRSADYLNWRYWKHPTRSFEMLTARRNGVLSGWVVFSSTAEDGSIVDLFGFDDTSMWARLLFGVVELLRSRRVITLSLPILETHPCAGLLQSMGFRPRESYPVVIYDPAMLEASPERAAARWYLMDGDRES